MIRVGEVHRQVEFALQFEGPGELAAVVQGRNNGGGHLFVVGTLLRNEWLLP